LLGKTFPQFLPAGLAAICGLKTALAVHVRLVEDFGGLDYAVLPPAKQPIRVARSGEANRAEKQRRQP
jgi:hypothetical protein